MTFINVWYVWHSAYNHMEAIPHLFIWNESDSFKTNNKPIATNKNHKQDKHLVSSMTSSEIMCIENPILSIGKNIPLWLNLPFKKTEQKGEMRPLLNPSRLES